MAEETEKERRYFQLQMCEVFILYNIYIYIQIKHSSISACKRTSFDCRFIHSYSLENLHYVGLRIEDRIQNVVSDLKTVISNLNILLERMRN